ncbi:uncharacterized protein BO97DRAFT_439783 [Aspergillus homomorphus CBS 101889]|uniref:Mitochondrial outer membrane translocase complex, subunit Tom5 n=1 Tax=Aspergillus homomorphus (strain CBS 101889) TaxID=1450537 RepID=A0A395IAK4_ASPHC|nr:hypothetical protein BO97DRAFT_439783 [Aspergillus homomorphus CBS 101889]RAL16839.1 hypothetical protein BO97DRAFT_439783 [Aspergillus homomorphus CBS 101889]
MEESVPPPQVVDLNPPSADLHPHVSCSSSRKESFTMFAPGQEQLSREDIKAGEAQANQTIRMAVTGGVLLYLSPFALDFVKKFL